MRLSTRIPFSFIVLLVLSPLFNLVTLASAYPSSNYEDACVHCPEYILNTAEYKENVIMSKVYANEYDYDDLPPFKTLCDSVALLDTVDFNNIFDRFSDERPAQFNRFFHFHGMVASVKFESTGDHDFTGIFRGAEHGVLRWSPLAPLLQEKYLVNHFIGTFFFSFGIKFFRDGIHSGNMNVGDSAKGLRSRERQFYEKPNFNIFSRTLDNLSGIGDTFDPLFGEFEKFSGVISPADAAAYDQFGQEETAPKSPYVVSFRPPKEYKEKFGRGRLDFRTWATNENAIPPGTVIYTAWTTIDKASGEATLCVDGDGIPLVDDQVETECPEQKVVKLGNVVMKTRFYADAWTDKWLFFQHHRMCPKDQAICQYDQNGNTPLPDFGQPDPTFPFPVDEFCVSSDDKSGELSGIPPVCPFGSVIKEAGTCYGGQVSGVESLQQQSCPVMEQLAQDILTTAPDADTSLPSCTTGFKVGNWFLSAFLGILSPSLRGIIAVFPPSKIAIDFLFGLLPFGQ